MTIALPCTTSRRYETIHAAQRMADYFSNSLRVKLTPARCHHCLGLHLQDVTK